MTHRLALIILTDIIAVWYREYYITVIYLTLMQYTYNVGTIVQRDMMYMCNRNVGDLPRNVNVVVKELSHRTN